MPGQIGNRAYSDVERKKRKRIQRRAHKTLPSLARRRRAHDIKMSMKLKGTL
jgi:hypothetical protein